MAIDNHSNDKPVTYIKHNLIFNTDKSSHIPFFESHSQKNKTLKTADVENERIKQTNSQICIYSINRNAKRLNIMQVSHV